MAKSTKTTASKSRGSKKAARSAPQKGSAKKTRAAPAKRAQARSAPTKSATKRSPRNQAAPAQSWTSSVGALLTSQLGREILADVLDSAAGVLRRNRDVAQQVAASGEAALDSGRDMATAAFDASTNVAGEVASATRGIAQTAAGALAELASDAMNAMTSGAAGTGRGRGGRGGRGSKKRNEGGRSGS
jgi:hypothetical protein